MLALNPLSLTPSVLNMLRLNTFLVFVFVFVFVFVANQLRWLATNANANIKKVFIF